MTIRPYVVLATGIMTMAVLFAGCGEKPATATQPPPAAEVGVITIQTRPVTLTTELAGRTSPYLVAEVRPQVGGIIQKRLFTEGAEVKAGELLYQIDPATYQAAFGSAQATLARAEANLGAVRLKEERYRQLVAINAISKQEYDDASAALKEAEAELAAAQAALEGARINLDYTRVKAPISGRIGRSAVTTGALVTAGQSTPLATIQQLDPIYVDVTQSNADLLRLKAALANGQLKKGGNNAGKVRLLLEDGSAYPHAGTLKFSEVTVDPSTGSVTLRTLFPNPEQLLLPGMFVRAVLEEGVSEQAILIPQRGVTRNPAGNPMVLLVGAEEKVEARVIGVARTIGDDWLVTAGVQAGDRVILEGLQRARPGTPVKAVPFGAPAAPPQAAQK